VSLLSFCIALVATYGICAAISAGVKWFLKDSKIFLLDRPVNSSAVPRVEHDQKRFNTYPFAHRHANTWYHLCDAKEIADGILICLAFTI
jgi:hypothetical protein